MRYYLDSVYERLYPCPGLRMSEMSKSSKPPMQASQRHFKAPQDLKGLKDRQLKTHWKMRWKKSAWKSIMQLKRKRYTREKKEIIKRS